MKQFTGGQTMVSLPRPEVLRSRRAWLAHTHQALIAPVHTLIELVGMMIADARERGQEEFHGDLEKIHVSGRALLTRFHELLDPTRFEGAEIDTLRMLRHDLRTPLTHILGYCELWLEDAETFFLDSFVDDLREVHELGKRMLERLDEIGRLLERTALPSPPEGGRGEEDRAVRGEQIMVLRNAAKPVPFSSSMMITTIAIF